MQSTQIGMSSKLNLIFMFISGPLVIAYGLEECSINLAMYENVSKEKALIKCLLERYKLYTTVGRPVTNTSDIISVDFGLSLIQIMNVDEKNQVLETNVWYTYQWKDALLTWDPKQFDDISKIMVSPDDIWLPDIVLYNFADSRLKEQRSALVNIFSDGTILWMPQAILKSTCAFNTKYFPFDENECHLKFGSWTHDGTKMDLKFFDGKEQLMVDDFVPGNEWDIIGNRAERNVKLYECCKETPFLDLMFYMRLKRRTAFYGFIVLIPCALLSCLTLVIFWVPPEAPAKLMLGMNIFMAFFLLLVVLSKSTPKAAESIPLIGAYFCLSMVMITMSTVLATVVANMFFRGVRLNRAPKWLRMLMIDGIARILCLRKDLIENEPSKPVHANKNNYAYHSTTKTIACEMVYSEAQLLDNGRENRNQNFEMSSKEDVQQNGIFLGDDIHEITFSPNLSDDIRFIREELEQVRNKKAKVDQKEKCLREWKVICCVTDRVFFICYLLINIIGIAVIIF